MTLRCCVPPTARRFVLDVRTPDGDIAHHFGARVKWNKIVINRRVRGQWAKQIDMGCPIVADSEITLVFALFPDHVTTYLNGRPFSRFATTTTASAVVVIPLCEDSAYGKGERETLVVRSVSLSTLKEAALPSTTHAFAQEDRSVFFTNVELTTLTRLLALYEVERVSAVRGGFRVTFENDHHAAQAVTNLNGWTGIVAEPSRR